VKKEVNVATQLKVLQAISDAKSIRLLCFFATGHQLDTHDILVQLKLSRREYYSRTSNFVKLGLARYKHRKCFLTKFGMIIYEMHLILVEAINVMGNEGKNNLIFTMERSPKP
jgi:hypothetical protein